MIQTKTHTKLAPKEDVGAKHGGRGKNKRCPFPAGCHHHEKKHLKAVLRANWAMSEDKLEEAFTASPQLWQLTSIGQPTGDV